MAYRFVNCFKKGCLKGYISLDKVCLIQIEKVRKGFVVIASEGDDDDECYEVSPSFPSMSDAQEYMHSMMKKINGVDE